MADETRLQDIVPSFYFFYRRGWKSQNSASIDSPKLDFQIEYKGSLCIYPTALCEAHTYFEQLQRERLDRDNTATVQLCITDSRIGKGRTRRLHSLRKPAVDVRANVVSLPKRQGQPRARHGHGATLDREHQATFSRARGKLHMIGQTQLARHGTNTAMLPRPVSRSCPAALATLVRYITRKRKNTSTVQTSPYILRLGPPLIRPSHALRLN